MNWDDTPEQAAFREEVRAFVAERFPGTYRPDSGGEQSLEPEDVRGYNWAEDRASDDPERREGARAWAAALAERGWITPHWPAEYGGAGLSAMEEFILQEELMRAGVPTVNGIGAFLLGPTLLVHGTDEQKAAHLPGIARGEVTWAQGFSEPGSGSDLASLRTRAVLAPPRRPSAPDASLDGEGGAEEYVVDGQKVWTSLGQYADWLFVLVRTDPDAEPRHRGITFLLIEASAPGVTIRPITDLRGATPYCEIFFEGVRVPVANRVGEENRGWYVAMTALGFERAGIGATIKYEQALHDLVRYLRSDEGRAFARAGGSYRREIAQRLTEVRVLYNLARYTVSRQEAGAEPGFEASVNQLFSAELHQRLARTGAKAFGRSGALWSRGDGAPLNATFTHMRRDAVAATFLGGTSEIQRNVIATRGLHLPRS